MRLKVYSRLALCLPLLGLAALCGCSKSEAENTAVTTEQQKQAIQANDSMPPQAKAEAMRSVEESKARAAAMQQNAPQKP